MLSARLPTRLLLPGAIIAVLVMLAALLLGPDTASGQGTAAVTSVAVSSTPIADQTYALGETILVTLTFGEAVDVTGTPRLKIDMDPADWGEKWANYESGSGTADLTFAHEVVEPNLSTQGIAVLENTLELNGGEIRSTSSGDAADLAHEGLDHDANHKVDWRVERAEEDSPPEPTPEPEPPAKPTGLQVSTQAGSLDVSVNWNDVDGADDYWVRWRTAGSGSELNEGLEVEESETELTVDDYGEWVVRVQACNDAGCGKPLAQRFAVEPAQDPLRVSISASAIVVPVEEEVILTAVITNPPTESKPSYRWELDLGSWVAMSTEPTFSYLTAAPESQAFRVTITYDSEDTATSEPLTVTWKELPAVPENLVVSASAGALGMSAAWDAADGATSYRLSWRRADAEFQSQNRATTTATAATFTVSEAGRWVARLEGCNDAGCGKPLDRQFDVVLPPGTPENLEVATTPGELEVSAAWDPVEGASFYRMIWRQVGERSRSVDVLEVDGPRAEASVSDFGQWEVYLSACNAGGCGDPAVRTADVEQVAATQDDTTAPSLDYAYVNGTHSLLLVFDEALDGDSVPAASAFTVSRDGSRCVQ